MKETPDDLTIHGLNGSKIDLAEVARVEAQGIGYQATVDADVIGKLTGGEVHQSSRAIAAGPTPEAAMAALAGRLQMRVVVAAARGIPTPKWRPMA